MKPGISICLVLGNRIDNLKWFLESVERQDYDGTIEICIGDVIQDAGIFALLDRYSDRVNFKYATVDRTKSFIPINSKTSIAEYNTCIRNMPTYDFVLKIDQDLVLKEESFISECVGCLERDETNKINNLYTTRTHFTYGENWYLDLEDILFKYTDHYLFVEGMPLISSAVLSCAAFSRSNFIDLGGFEESFVQGYGFEDKCFIEQWERYFNCKRCTLDLSVINIRPPHDQESQSLVELNRRRSELLKEFQPNGVCIDVSGNLVEGFRKWGNPEMLSKIYTIKDGSVVDVFSYFDDAVEVDVLL